MQSASVLVTTAFNWLDPLDVHSAYHAWRPGLRIAEVIPSEFELPEAFDIQFAINGRKLTLFEAEIYDLQPGDAVLATVIPLGGGGGKNPLATVAMVALLVTAPAIGGWLVSGAMSGMMSAGLISAEAAIGMAGAMGTAGAIAGGLVAVGGAVAINAVLPPGRVGSGRAIGADPLQESPNYGWAPTNPIENGRPVPILYGRKENFAPFKAGQFISTDGDKQYLNMLFIIGEGPVDAISDVKINGNPIGNYTEVVVETRQGTPDQSVIPAFNDAVSEQAVGVKISTNWHTVTLSGNNTQSIGIGISCLQGLWYANDKGGLDSLSVTIDMECRVIGATAWTHLDTQTITASQRAAVRRYWRYAVPTGHYEVRVRFNTPPASDTRHMSDTWWEYCHEIVPDDFRLPNMALFAVRALATDQLNGSAFTVTCTAERSTLPLPDGNGGTVSRPASNPAWMALDLLLNRRYGVAWPVSQVALQDFADAAAWCDEKGITGAMYFDTDMNFETAASYLGRFGRFRILPRGTSIGCISDRPEQFPDQGLLVTPANILNGTCGVGYAALTDRADAWEVTWFHPERGPETLFVPGEKYGTIAGRTPRIRQETLYPCTTEAQAYRWARYMDRCNRYLARTISLRCNVDALGSHVAPGRIIQIAHDLLHRTQSARVLTGTPTEITLNRPVTLEPGTTYQVLVRHVDRQCADTGNELHESVTLAPVSQHTSTSTLHLAAPLQFAPSETATVTVGELGRNARWYRVLSIARTQDMRVQIEALEYDEAVYADEGQPPSIPSSATLPSVTALVATLMQVTEDLVAKRLVSLAWRGDAMRWSIFVRKLGSGGNAWWLAGTTADPSFIVRNLEVGFAYRIAVTATGHPADGQTVDVDFALNTPSGSIRPITAMDGGLEVPVYVTVGGEPTQLMGVF